ncbi:Protein HGH1-like protein [Frankliniella fusca]|uniref:Protein HGH1 homolog n=1 Tax=Frankliniella fusca TaxID=407009 RepID=A0AAE1H378_9NEOP|nr:Protein HGH1-like protein [Frankliniella fusca]
MGSLDEFLQFLTPETRLDLKVLAVEQVLGMTGREEGRTLLCQNLKILQHLIKLCSDKVPGVARDSCLALVNLSGDEDGAVALLSEEHGISQNQGFVRQMVELALDPQSPLADPALMVLSNITRPSQLTSEILSLIVGDDRKDSYDESKVFEFLERVIGALTSTRHNSVGANLHYLGPLLSNLSQLPVVRRHVLPVLFISSVIVHYTLNIIFFFIISKRFILDHEKKVIHRLIPFTEYQDSLVRRGGIVGCLRNCCFDTDEHAWLLGPDVDILPHLLLPLAGPEEFDEEDNNKLPVDLQWLPEDKTRESDPDIRRMLLEALEQLCATKVHREYMRERNVYIILRELHKWEKDRQVLLACENLVDLLIRKEEEIGEENLHAVEVPEDLVSKFEKMDKEFLEDK